MPRKVDLTNKTFGYLTVLKKDETKTDEYYRNYWICQCICGNTVSVPTNILTNGHKKSCGCYPIGSWNKKHGMSRTKIYGTWLSMRNRCYRESSRCWKDYGGRGISVCDEWKDDFSSFYDWAKQTGYAEGLTIDRIDPNGNYCPENCRWITMLEQQRNKTNNVHIVYNGEDRTLRELCIDIGFPYKTAHQRYVRLKMAGREISAEVLFAPIQKSKIAKRYRNY